jgi:hypothetical protein
MSADGTYNGWKNYETWSVALFIDNESNECIREARRAAKRDTWGDALKEWFEEYFLTDPETGEPYGNAVVRQFLSAAMSEVAWKEVRDHYINEEGNDDEEEDE